MTASPPEERLPRALAQAENLPVLPAIAEEVLRLCREKETTLDDLAAVLARDAALSARLLRFANSSLANAGDDVRTLQRAALVLGMKSVQLLSLAFSLVSSFSRQGGSPSFDHHGFWQRSIVRAVAARTLASRVGSFAQDEAFLSGLLGDIGQVVLCQCLPREYEEVLQRARAEGGWPSLALERALLGFDRADAGGALLRDWQLPEMIVLAVAHAPRPEELPASSPRELTVLVRLLSVAASATELVTEVANAAALQRTEELARVHFALRPQDVREYLKELEAPIRETAELLGHPLPERNGIEETLTRARAELLKLRLEGVTVPEAARPAGDLDHRSTLLQDSAFVDPLTRIANRAAFESFVDLEVGARLAGHLDRPLGVLLIEVDRFGELERDSTDTGAAIERIVAGLLARLVRKCDLPARLAPGNFAVILAEASPSGMRALAERVRAEVEQVAPTVLAGGLSVSFGGVCLAAPRTGSDGRALLEAAQHLLERAKSQGTDRCELHATLLQPR